jgi:hypothetical protein
MGPRAFGTMRRIRTWAAAGLVIAGAGGEVRTFDVDPVGQAPPGFAFHAVGYTLAARWLVQRDGKNGYLTHHEEPGGGAGYALAVLADQPRGRIELSVRVRMSSGRRAAGVVWRVRDSENYYLARLDLDRQDVALYRVVQGNRVRIEGEDDLELDRAAWHTIKIVQESEDIRVYLGGIRVIRARDRTFAGGGGAGVWCTGDGVIDFDDLRVESGAEHAGSRGGR